MVFRKDLLTVLKNRKTGLVELARMLDVPCRELEEDLRHLKRSMKHGSEHLVVIPACCRKCGFVFQKDKLHKPGKCPRCHGTWVQEPVLSIEHRT